MVSFFVGSWHDRFDISVIREGVKAGSGVPGWYEDGGCGTVLLCVSDAVGSRALGGEDGLFCRLDGMVSASLRIYVEDGGLWTGDGSGQPAHQSILGSRLYIHTRQSHGTGCLSSHNSPQSNGSFEGRATELPCPWLRVRILWWG